MLPPYGNFATRYAPRANGGLPPGRDFQAGADAATRLQQKKDFVQALAQEISRDYWPTWAADQWQGDSTTDMIAFTRDDFTLLAGLRPKLFDHVNINGRANVMRTHFDCFKTEDTIDSKDPLANFLEFRHYLPTLTTHWHDAVAGVFIGGIDRKVGPLTMEFKAAFQRPRPYQAASLLGQNQFTYELAVTASHPSLVAGHCIQGLFGGISVHLLNATHSPAYTSEVQMALQQFSTDFGDRRVLAGVHYPSDSLISWLVCFRLLEFVTQNNERAAARAFLSAAISQSCVWKHVISNKNSLQCPRFQKLLSEISQLVGAN